MIRIVVEMKGGLIQNVFSPDWPEAQVIAIDWDALESDASLDGNDPVSSTSRVDDYCTIHPVTKTAVDRASGGEALSVEEAQDMFDALDQKP